MARGGWTQLILTAAVLAGSASAALGEYTLPVARPLVTATPGTTGPATASPQFIPPGVSGLGAIGVPAARALFPTLTGAGQTVAIIDTGLDYTHPAIAPNYLTGYDFVHDVADPMDTWAGGGGHGTHVAGIVAGVSTGADPLYQGGVAPGAKIISLKVFDPATGDASDANVVAALNWVAAHHQQYNITTVNMSLGDGTETTWSKIAPNDAYDLALKTLKQQGVFVAVASGNDAYLNGQSMPAASRYAVSVGATYPTSDWVNNLVGSMPDPYPHVDADGQPVPADIEDYRPVKDDIAYFSNRYKTADDGATTLMAPGVFIRSTVPVALDTEDDAADGYTGMSGTSMAAPEVAGAAILVRQALEQAGALDPDPPKQVDQILSVLQTTGVPLYDTFYWFGGNNATVTEIPAGSGSVTIPRGTWETYARVDVDAAVESVLGVPEPASVAVFTVGIAGLLRRRRVA